LFSVLTGTAAVYFLYKYLRLKLDEKTALAGAVLFSFLPPKTICRLARGFARFFADGLLLKSIVALAPPTQCAGDNKELSNFD
jgi:hypothetical protein